MAQLTIHWTETAIRQRNYIFGWKQNPELGKKTDFKNTRAVSLGHYSILYQKSNFKIIITGFWDNRQEPEKLLKFLKNIANLS